MNLQVFAAMEFKDSQGLANFLQAHYYAHLQIDQVIAQKGLGVQDHTYLDDPQVLNEWAKSMNGEDGGSALRDWLGRHNDLHTTENSALGFGGDSSFDEVDFSDEQQFYDWMKDHADAHDALNSAVGVS